MDCFESVASSITNKWYLSIFAYLSVSVSSSLSVDSSSSSSEVSSSSSSSSVCVEIFGVDDGLFFGEAFRCGFGVLKLLP